MLHPDSLFGTYKEKIAALENTDRNTILSSDFLLESSRDLSIYYAPHNEYINPEAKVLIVGITPGWSQTELAYRTALSRIHKGLSDHEICRQCKFQSRFAGSMRRNLITMLDELGLHKHLELASSADLFEPQCDLLHTTSLIKYPCFFKRKNYSGHSPAITASAFLSQYLNRTFITELRCLEQVQLIIPLGSAVEAAFKALDFGADKVLWGFPHPSGLNGGRIKQFQANRANMEKTLNKL